jgi:hypothetical protein
MSHCIFSGNQAEQGGAIYGVRHGPDLISCTLFGNSATNGNAVAWDVPPSRIGGGPFRMIMTNCILWNGGDEFGQRNGELPDITVTYSDIQGGWPGEGNIDADPCFAVPGYWGTNGTPRFPIEVSVDGDYHLKSQAGRWDANSASWIKDDATSPCIDAGDINSLIGLEPFPNGGRINMGAYGGTAEASKSYFGEPVCETTIVGDINGDCKVDFADFALMTFHWLEDNPPVPSPPPLPLPEPPRPKGRTCFPAETPVWVNGSLVQISNAVSWQMVGETYCDLAMSCLEKIEKVQEHEGTFECRDIMLESGNRISVVDAHCFMLDSGQWIAAQNLTSGLRLKTLTGAVGIKSVAIRAVPFVGKVYNLKVKGADRYLVGEDGLIVRDY